MSSPRVTIIELREQLVAASKGLTGARQERDAAISAMEKAEAKGRTDMREAISDQIGSWSVYMGAGDGGEFAAEVAILAWVAARVGAME